MPDDDLRRRYRRASFERFTPTEESRRLPHEMVPPNVPGQYMCQACGTPWPCEDALAEEKAHAKALIEDLVTWIDRPEALAAGLQDLASLLGVEWDPPRDFVAEVRERFGHPSEEHPDG